jgi:hypothetical protein
MNWRIRPEERYLETHPNSTLKEYIDYLDAKELQRQQELKESAKKHEKLLAINITGNLGLYNSLSSSCADSYNRELVTDVEEFLERAAKLKGFTYKRKDIMKINGIEIKPGMVLIGKDADNRDSILVTFPSQRE